jgi:hypothetical protein
MKIKGERIQERRAAIIMTTDQSMSYQTMPLQHFHSSSSEGACSVHSNHWPQQSKPHQPGMKPLEAKAQQLQCNPPIHRNRPKAFLKASLKGENYFTRQSKNPCIDEA